MKTPNPKARNRIANLIIVALTLFLGGTLAREYFYPARQANNPLLGSRLSIRGVSWGGAEQTLLLVLDEHCTFTEQSVPFYHELAQLAAGRRDVRLVGVVETSVEAGKKFAEENGVRVEVVRWDFRKFGITQTPNLILVDGAGDITRQWVGFLSAAGEADVVSRLFGSSDAAVEAFRRDLASTPSDLQGGPYGISLPELLDLMKGRRVTLLDLDDRESYAAGHIAQAKNIPVDELYIRALNEVEAGAPVVLYTRNYSRLFLANVQVLKRQGFGDVKVLRGGLDGWKGAGLPLATGRGAK